MENSAQNTKVNMMRGMPKDAGYRANSINAIQGVDKSLGENTLNSYNQEAQSNAQLGTQADATNAEISNNEAAINNSQKQNYNNTQAGYRAAVIQAPVDAFSRVGSRKNMWDMAQLNENYDIYKDPSTGRPMFVPKVKNKK